MKKNILRYTALFVTAVLFTTNFWSCSKNEDPEHRCERDAYGYGRTGGCREQEGNVDVG